jgi:ubiquinone/menaquinone biosynthesis C-methylase UbiE
MSVEKSYTESHKEKGKGAGYDEHYSTDRWRRFLWSQEQRALKNIIDTFFKGQKVHLLDFACGTGRICKFFEPYVETVTGVDVSESMLEIARQKLAKAQVLHADITRETVLNGRKFNLITAFRFFLNAEPQLREAALKALVPLLADDGYLVFNNHRNSTAPLVRFKYERAHNQRNLMSMQETNDLMQKFGLKIVKLYPIGFLPLPKIKLPQCCNNAIDGIARNFKSLENFSESPIVVCHFSAT